MAWKESDDLVYCESEIEAFHKPAYRYIRKSDELPVSIGGGDIEEMQAKVKLFMADAGGRFFIVAYDPEDKSDAKNRFGTAWGVAEFFGERSREFGPLDMQELVNARGKLKLPLERELGFKPVSVGELLHRGVEVEPVSAEL